MIFEADSSHLSSVVTENGLIFQLKKQQSDDTVKSNTSAAALTENVFGNLVKCQTKIVKF